MDYLNLVKFYCFDVLGVTQSGSGSISKGVSQKEETEGQCH